MKNSATADVMTEPVLTVITIDEHDGQTKAVAHLYTRGTATGWSG
jgi:hypothetical protein